MTFTLDNYGITLSSSDHNKNDKTFTLRATQQGNLPLNEYFYFKIKGVWRSVSDSNNIIEYYLIYACRYVSKLVISLQPNYKLVLKGQPLTINYQAQFYNMKAGSVSTNYQVNWTCPQVIQKYCNN